MKYYRLLIEQLMNGQFFPEARPGARQIYLHHNLSLGTHLEVLQFRSKGPPGLARTGDGQAAAFPLEAPAREPGKFPSLSGHLRMAEVI